MNLTQDSAGRIILGAGEVPPKSTQFAEKRKATYNGTPNQVHASNPGPL